MESMPSSCYIGDAYPYMQKHDPFIYYNDIRTDAARCTSHVVPFTQLSTDLSAGTSPHISPHKPHTVTGTPPCLLRTGDDRFGAVAAHPLASPPPPDFVGPLINPH